MEIKYPAKGGSDIGEQKKLGGRWVQDLKCLRIFKVRFVVGLKFS